MATDTSMRLYGSGMTSELPQVSRLASGPLTALSMVAQG